MTLENLNSQLVHYKEQGNLEQVKFLEERIARKLKHPNYAHLRPVAEEVKEKPKDGKKPKR